MQGGVATDFIKWREDDGIGRTVRNGLNFTERGFGVRGAVGNPDRGNTAASQLKPGDIDWDHIFGKLGVRWFHTGGIFAPLRLHRRSSPSRPCKAANKHGTIVSYDLNYRPSLWKTIGGLKKAQEVNREIAKYVDVMIGNEEDFTASLGFEVKGAENISSTSRPTPSRPMIETAVKEYPELQGRRHHAAPRANRHQSTTGAPSSGTTASSTRASKYPKLEILDRVGGGDSLRLRPAVRFPRVQRRPEGRRNTAPLTARLASTTPGDTSMATRKEVEKTIGGGGARVVR